jgi:UDP-N-acetylglucosamine diphosphorylase/glucosamine-1-phosphate N-acetyltransferase
MTAESPRTIRFIDDGRGSFGPLTDLRPVHDLRCGLCSIAGRIERACRAAVSTPGRGTLVVHARLLSLGSLGAIAPGERRVASDGTFVAAFAADDLDDASSRAVAAARAQPSDSQVAAEFADTPWAITSRIDRTLAEDLAVAAPGERRALRAEEGVVVGDHPVFIDPTATLGPCCVIDASKGPVVVGARAVVRPLAVLVGPCIVCEGSIVAEHARLKASTVIGPRCRVGGEIGGTIFQGSSNKAHDGHLGDSFVGEWVNIGAGSDNSNLLNTYGEVIVRLEADSGLVRTGRQFWGSVIGDHAKLAIGTRLMTGTTIGTGAMIALSRPPATLVPRFAWLTDGADGPKSFRFDKFMETARAMMSRRGEAPTPEIEARLRELHARATGQ